MRVMVIVKANKDSEAGVLPSKEIIARMGQYNEELAKAGILLAAEGLHASAKGKRVKFSAAKRTVTDGPFAKTKELIAGFWLWQVKSMEEAVEWLKRAPFDGGVEIEIRQVFEAEDFGAELTPELRTQEEQLQIARTKGDGQMETRPTHEQAQLHLQIYDMRREARLRQARDWFFRNYFADTFDEAMRIAAPGTENGAFYMMVVSYWEQACALLNYGLLHEDLFFETSGEFFAVWERVQPTLAEGRKRFVSNGYLAHMEKAAQRYETWTEKRSPGHIAAMREWMKQMRAQMAKAA